MKTAKAILFSAVSLLTLVLSSEGVFAFQTTKPATLWGTGAMASCASAIGNFPNKVPYLNPYCTDVSDYGARDNVARLWTDNYQPPFSAGIYFGDNCPSGYWSNGRVCILYPAPPAVDAQKNLGNPSSCRELAGNPIHVGTGNKLLTEIDYQGSGAYPLAFVRYYNSMTNKSGPLGANWRSNYDRSLVISSSEPDKAWTQRPDGKILYFNKVGGVWTPDSDVVANLVEMANLTGWQLTIGDDDEREVYDASGKLLSIHNRTGLSHTLSYDNEGRLVSVNDPFGRSLSFGYDNSDRITTITDPAGNVTSYTYASITNNVVSVTYPGNGTPAVRTYLYNEPAYTANTDLPHALTGIIDENNSRFSTYQYDAAGRAVSTQHGGGAQFVGITYVTNGDGNIVSSAVTDATGTTRNYDFQTVLGTVRNSGISEPCTSGCGSVSAVTYDANGNIASRTDFNGNVATYTYDLARNLETSRTEAAGTPLARTIATQWNSTYRLPNQIEEPGKRTTFTYDTLGNLMQKTITDTVLNASRTWTYAYTYSATVPGAFTRVVADGPRTDVVDQTIYDYNATGDLVSTANALGHVTQVTSLDPHGRPLSITDANGLVTMLAYDSRGRLTSRVIGNETTSYAYDDAGELTRITLPSGAYLAYSYDAAHRLTQIQDQLGNKIVYTLDAMGNRTKEDIYDPANSLAQTRSRVYDTLNRLQKDIGGVNPSAEVTQYSYDSNGNLTTVTDPLNRVTANGYDALNRLMQVTDPASGITRYGYTATDELASVTDPRNLTTNYTRDQLNNLTQLQSPDSGLSSAIYDGAGNVVSRTDAKNQTTNYQYDALNRVTRETRADGSVVTFTYDAGTTGKGQLIGMTDPSGSTTWSYDPQGRLTQKQQAVGTLTRTTQYAYNAQGQLGSLTYPSGQVVAYTYNSNGQVSSVSVNGSPLLSNITYQPFGAPASWTFGNGQTVARGFDLNGRMSANTMGTLVYDAANRITGAYDKTFGYDALDRLTSFSDGVTPLTYEYDANGNRTRQTAGSVVNDYAVSSTSNQIQTITGGGTTLTYTHDANGSVTRDGPGSSKVYQYDAAGRFTYSVCVAQVYNGLGERVKKNATPCSPPRPFSTVIYFYDPAGKLIGEYGSAGSVVQETIYLGEMPVAVLKNGSTYYVHADHLNTPRKIYNGRGSWYGFGILRRLGRVCRTRILAEWDISSTTLGFPASIMIMIRGSFITITGRWTQRQGDIHRAIQLVLRAASTHIPMLLATQSVIPIHGDWITLQWDHMDQAPVQMLLGLLLMST